MSRRLGVFGGTFDPIHIGHLHLAESVAQIASLDAVLFLPVAGPAHRETHAPADDRRTMTELAISDNPRFTLDTTGLEQEAPAYTYEMMIALRKQHPGDEFFFIAGIDSLVRSRWRRLEDVAASVSRFYIAPRDGVDDGELATALADLPPDARARFERVDVSLVDVSSTAIRALVKEGRSIRYLVPDAVREHIIARALYR